MSQYSSLTNYETINKSERDITKDFDIKQFNTKFEKNDDELKDKLKEEYKIKINEIKDNCDTNYNRVYLKYGVIFISIGFLLLFIGIMISKYNKPKKIIVEQ
jgi:hypothetical protein